MSTFGVYGKLQWIVRNISEGKFSMPELRTDAEAELASTAVMRFRGYIWRLDSSGTMGDWMTPWRDEHGNYSFPEFYELRDAWYRMLAKYKERADQGGYGSGQAARDASKIERMKF